VGKCRGCTCFCGRGVHACVDFLLWCTSECLRCCTVCRGVGAHAFEYTCMGKGLTFMRAYICVGRDAVVCGREVQVCVRILVFGGVYVCL